MGQARRAAAITLSAVALGLAAAGQYYFFHRRAFLWDGLFLHGLAVLLFGLAWRLTKAKPEGSHSSGFTDLVRPHWLQKHLGSALLLGAGLLFASFATALSRDRAWNEETSGIVALWLLGIAAMVTATLGPLSWPLLRRSPSAGVAATTAVREWAKRKWQALHRSRAEIAAVIGLTALALILRATRLESVPFTLAGDEAWHGLLARQVLSGELRHPFVMGRMSMPTLFYWPLSWSLRLFGDNMVGLRLSAAIIGTLTIPLFYGFVRRLFGKWTAAASSLFLATYDYHIQYSRLATNNIWDPFFAVIVLWLVEVGMSQPQQARQTQLLTLAGSVLGLSVCFYTGSRLLPIMVVAYIAFTWLRRCRSQTSTNPVRGLGWPLCMLLLAFLAAAGPMLGFALSHPDDWNARINEAGILQSGWLAREPGLTDRSTAQILAEQLLRAAGAFHVFPDRWAFYDPDRPLLGFLAGGFAIFGMAWAVAHWRERRYFLVLIWFWAVIITGGMLTESPPASQRLVMAIPPVGLLVTIGVEQVIALFSRLCALRNLSWANAAVGLLMMVLAAGSIWFYFGEYTPARRYGSPNAETATMIGHYLEDLEGEYRAYFLGPPRIYWAFGTMTFLAPEIPGQDLVEPLGSPPDGVDRDVGAVFLVLPERQGEMAFVRQAFPEGVLHELVDPGGALRCIAYEVRP